MAIKTPLEEKAIAAAQLLLEELGGAATAAPLVELLKVAYMQGACHGTPGQVARTATARAVDVLKRSG